ncbi:hypothetical protein ABKN59_009689 [Abortiporus biennis]
MEVPPSGLDEEKNEKSAPPPSKCTKRTTTIASDHQRAEKEKADMVKKLARLEAQVAKMKKREEESRTKQREAEYDKTPVESEEENNSDSPTPEHLPPPRKTVIRSLGTFQARATALPLTRDGDMSSPSSLNPSHATSSATTPTIRRSPSLSISQTSNNCINQYPSSNTSSRSVSLERDQPQPQAISPFTESSNDHEANPETCPPLTLQPLPEGTVCPPAPNTSNSTTTSDTQEVQPATAAHSSTGIQQPPIIEPQLVNRVRPAGRPKAKNYRTDHCKLITEATHIYFIKTINRNPFPNAATSRRWVEECWNEVKTTEHGILSLTVDIRTIIAAGAATIQG